MKTGEIQGSETRGGVRANVQAEVRRPRETDADAIGEVIFAAFVGIADRHNFPRDFESGDFAAQMAQMLVTHPGFFGVVAEADGRVVGSNFIDMRDEVGGVGPITIHPDYQGHGLGRLLMQAVIEHGREKRDVRLVQDAFNTTSLSLYTSLGFTVTEPLAVMQGTPRDAARSDAVQPMREEDIDECAELCRRIHGVTRANELRDAMRQFTPMVLRRDGRIVAYCSVPQMWLINHGVAETEQDLTALLLGVGAAMDGPLGMLVPVRRGSFFRWCLEQGLRLVKPMNHMAMGQYVDPRGAFFPSVIY